MKLHPLLSCPLAALLCSCAATSVKETWKSPEPHSGPVSKIAIVAVDGRKLVREGFENRLFNNLNKGGTTALTTYDLLSLPEIKQDTKAAGERLRAAGADAVVVLRLADAASFYREVRPGRERYAGMVTGFEPGYWGTYYSMAFMDMSPTYGNLTTKVYIEASLFDLKTAKRLWSGISESVLKEHTDRVAEMDPVVEKFAAAMRSDGVIR